MAKPIEESKRISGRKARMDMKLSKSAKRRGVKTGVTKKEFFAILDKASQPVKREAESDSEKSET